MTSCELCESPARMYCESDQASLCWNCDFKVHGANFLVARHSRILLCLVCQSPTPWTASGMKLGQTVCVCEKCAADATGESGSNADDFSGEEDELQSDYDGDEEEDVGENDFDEEEADNQVVPWASKASSTLPTAPAMSSSSSEAESSTGDGECSISPMTLKRMRGDYSDLRSQGDSDDRFISRHDHTTAVARGDRDDETPADYLRPLKVRRVEAASTSTVQTRTGLIIESILRLQREIASGRNASAAIISLCRLCREPISIVQMR